MSLPGLRSLLNTDNLDEFLTKYWPDSYFMAKGPVERLAGLVDHDLDALIKMDKRYTRAFFRNVDGQSSSVYVNAGQEKALYDAGFTIYFHNLSSPALTSWIDAIDNELGLVCGVTRVSAFASRKGPGLKPHYDMNDNFVCQAKGHKRWKVWPNTRVINPTAGYTLGAKQLAVHSLEAPEGLPTKMPEEYETLDFTPGTVVFMPRGIWHDTETVEEESLHFNIQSGLAMWKDAIEFLMTRKQNLLRADLREPIRLMFEGQKLRPEVAEEIKKKLVSLVDEMVNGDIEIDRTAFRAFVRARRPQNN